jgi:hypothetical protein
MSDEADRLDRLENAVQELRNDFDTITPAITRLVAIEGDIQKLITQLDTPLLKSRLRCLPVPHTLPGNRPPLRMARKRRPRRPRAL